VRPSLVPADLGLPADTSVGGVGPYGHADDLSSWRKTDCVGIRSTRRERHSSGQNQIKAQATVAERLMTQLPGRRLGSR
jgi:hypothetical protein